MLFPCTFTLVCLALSADFRLTGTSRLPLRPDLDTTPIISNSEQAPDDYSFQDYVIWFMTSGQDNPENSVLFREHSLEDEMDVMKRQEENLDEFQTSDTKSNEKKRKPGCRNYFWKSWTAC